MLVTVNYFRSLNFNCFPGCLLVAADYSQLELRLLAHLSADSKLKAVLNGGEDVFRNLSAVWNNIPCHTVQIWLKISNSIF